MHRKVIGLTMLWIALAGAPALAEYRAEMAIDRSFGNDGFAEVPVLDPAHRNISPMGFVHLPLTGGYLYFSVQQIGMATYVVATRFTAAGMVNTAWSPMSGSRFYSVPAPTSIEDVRLAVGIEGVPVSERIYLALTHEVGTRRYLHVTKFAPDGSLLMQASSHLPASFTLGLGTLTAMAAGANLYGGGSGVLIAVQGRNVEAGRTVLVQDLGTGAINEFGSTSWLSGSELRVNQLTLRTDGTVEVVGSKDGKAMHVLYNAQTNLVQTQKTFDFPCAAGSAVASTIDGLMHPSSFGSDVLLVGRVRCGTAAQIEQELVRVSSIETAPAIVWGAATGQSTSKCANLSSECDYVSAGLIDTAPYQAYATTPDLSWIRIDIDRAPGRVVGTDAPLRSIPMAVLPAYQEGAVHEYPYMVGFAARYLASGDLRWGLARMAADRVFANGLDALP